MTTLLSPHFVVWQDRRHAYLWSGPCALDKVTPGGIQPRAGSDRDSRRRGRQPRGRPDLPPVGGGLHPGVAEAPPRFPALALHEGKPRLDAPSTHTTSASASSPMTG